jgi:hypothetical protein
MAYGSWLLAAGNFIYLYLSVFDILTKHSIPIGKDTNRGRKKTSLRSTKQSHFMLFEIVSYALA